MKREAGQRKMKTMGANNTQRTDSAQVPEMTWRHFFARKLGAEGCCDWLDKDGGSE